MKVDVNFELVKARYWPAVEQLRQQRGDMQREMMALQAEIDERQERVRALDNAGISADNARRRYNERQAICTLKSRLQSKRDELNLLEIGGDAAVEEIVNRIM